jgi:hypothetical protein
VVSLDELAIPFAHRLAQHLRTNDKQGTPKQSRFLEACRAYDTGELDEEGLRTTTVQIGFNNVIDAFTSSTERRSPSVSSSTNAAVDPGSASQTGFGRCSPKGTAPTSAKKLRRAGGWSRRRGNSISLDTC